MRISMRTSYVLILCYCSLLLASCENESFKEEKNPLNILFESNQVSQPIFPFRKSPKDHKLYLIENVSLSKCNKFGDCALNMGYILEGDTIYMPTRLDGLFVDKDNKYAINCGDRGQKIVILVNSYSRVLLEEYPVEIDSISRLVSLKIEEFNRPRIIGLSIKWHTFTSKEAKERIFKQLVEVMVNYYNSQSIKMFNKSLSSLNEKELLQLRNTVIPLEIHQYYNQKIALPSKNIDFENLSFSYNL